MARYQLVSFKLCPYVQKTLIALNEREVEYEVEYIDLENKPDWFLKISPFGKVPVLRVDDAVIFESTIINEFIEESADGEKMHPADPVARARARSWVEFGAALNIDQWRMSMAKTEAEVLEQATAARAKLAKVEAELGEGPYFEGEKFTLVDAGWAPALQRLAWMDEIHPELKIFEATPRVSAWWAAMSDRASITRSAVPEIKQLFIDYMRGTGPDERRAEPSWLGRRTLEL